MAKVTYKSYNQNDSLLFPHCIGDFIPENDPVRVLDAIVEHLDISAIEATYKGGGASSFAPRMLLKVILYAYLQSSAIEAKDSLPQIAVAHNIRKMISKGYCH